jgi:hypothetical protein
MIKTRISRRAVLRGALIGGGMATIPLPRLGAMLNGNGTAYAATGKPIQRFGVYFIGNGFLPSTFAPRPWVTGPLGNLGPALAPLEKVKAKITAVSGFDVKLLREKGTPHCHFIGALTGAPPSGQIYKLPSIDQVIALQGPLGRDVPYKSLEVGGTARSGGVRASNVSAKGPNQHNVTDYNPSSVFSRLFKNFTPPTPTPGGNTAPPPVDPTVALDKSILDSIRQDAADLNKRLGKDDQIRLGVHLDGIREIEKRIDSLSAPRTTADAMCKKGNDVTMGASGDGLDPKQVDVMDQVLVMAMACDLTRVFTYTLTKPAAHINYGIAGVSGDFHGISHGGNEAQITKGHNYTMGMFAGLLEKMDAVQEGGATMLDNSTVIISTCVSWPAQHTPWEWPCVIGGRGGFRDGGNKFNLQGGWHYRSESGGDNFSKVNLTLANINGCGLKEIGMVEGRVDTEVQGIRGAG